MVKFNLKKMLAAGLLSAAAVFAGVAAVNWEPAVVAYAEDPVESVDPAESTFGYLALKQNAAGTATILKGNYIYVAYYTDEACTKLKSTVVFERNELTGDRIPLGSIKLTKGGFFKVYDEITGVDAVKPVEIVAQTGKIKVKILDLSKDKFFEAIEITVGSKKLDASNWGNYYICMGPDGGELSEVVDTENIPAGKTVADILNEYWTDMKVVARMNGLTVGVKVAETPEDSKTIAGMPSVGKFKIAAAAKAPKVTIDYVNGSYVLPKGVSYTITGIYAGDDATTTNVTEVAGMIKVPAWTTTVDADKPKITLTGAKVTMSTGDIVETYNKEQNLQDASKVTKAAIIVWSEKAKKMDSVKAVYVVEGLKKLTTTDINDVNKTIADKATYKLGDKEIAKLTFTDKGISIEAKADLAYEYAGKTVTLKAGKSTKTELAVATGAKITIRALGTKASKTVEGTFGSDVTEITNEFGGTFATTMVVYEEVTVADKAAFDGRTNKYYVAKDGAYEAVTEYTANTTYYTKATYTKVTTTTPAGGTKYYIPKQDGTCDEKSSLEKFEADTTYYTKTVEAR